jgi:CHAT domain-containing protein
MLLHFALEDRQVERAFLTTERARARSLLVALGNQRLAPSRGADPGLVAQANGLRLQISRWERELRDPSSVGERRQIEASLQRARADWEHLFLRLKLSNPEYASVVAVAPPSVEVLRAAVPADAVVVSYFTTHQGALAFVLDRERLEHVPLPLADRALLRLAVCFGQSLGRARSDALPTEALRGVERVNDCAPRSEAAADLFEALVRPLLPRLAGKRVFLVPHGVLHYVPFAALWDRERGRYWLEDATLSYLPSASVLVHLQAKESPLDGTALVLGDPEHAIPEVSRLPGARLEAETAGRLLGVAPLLGPAATEARLHELGGKVDLLHVAAHAFFQPGSPRFSWMALAPDERQDGRLEVHELLSTVDLSGVNLVVLSACQSAVGERSVGDEVVGLTRAILYAGSPGVISTLWSVDDRATAVLMGDFYRSLLAGASPAEALRTAQLALLREGWEDPALWAAFTLTGDPRARWATASVPAESLDPRAEPAGCGDQGGAPCPREPHVEQGPLHQLDLAPDGRVLRAPEACLERHFVEAQPRDDHSVVLEPFDSVEGRHPQARLGGIVGGVAADPVDGHPAVLERAGILLDECAGASH